MKYSASFWDPDIISIDDADLATIHKYIDLLSLKDGMRVLEIGSGWGSFSLTASRLFPHIQFVCFSNSQTQIDYIKSQAPSNLKALRLNINELSLASLDERESFDRIISIECLEHSRNYAKIFKIISNELLKEDGQCLFQVLCHRVYTMLMDSSGWLGRNFFTGGVIPSRNLFHHFNQHLVCVQQLDWNGVHYQKSLNAWLGRMYASRRKCLAALGGSQLAYQNWRMFYLVTSECFGYQNGNEYMLTLYIMKKRQ